MEEWGVVVVMGAAVVWVLSQGSREDWGGWDRAWWRNQPVGGDADFPGWRGTNYCSKVGQLIIPPLLCMNHRDEERAVYDSQNKSQMWYWFGAGRGKLWSSYMTLFYKQLIFSTWFNAVGLLLSELLSFLPKAWFVSANSLGRCVMLAL